MRTSQVDLHLPRFKVEETYDLKDMLVALGVVDAFSSQDADLSPSLQLEDKLTAEKLLEWTSSQNMRTSQVDLHLPRFKVEETYDLKDMLRALGVVDSFNSQKADFSGMTRKNNLVVSKALHKSFVEVNEEGTEAAAATGIVIRETAALHYERFHCDHPFLFFIRHNKTNSILFLGRVSSP
ncbi:hypothetical protein CB1_000632080 [Camelus ferus]|nr:hypothetical protein CB1_000632080 [Camelus ferus]